MNCVLRFRTVAGLLLVGLGLVLFLTSGCRREAAGPLTPAAPADAPPLRLLVIGDSELAKVIQREWDARTAGELALRELSVDELLEWQHPRLAADVVIYPSQLLGDLAGRDWLAHIPADDWDDPAFQSREIFPAIRKQVLVWGEDPIATPLGGAQLFLFYRRDIFEKLGVEPPQTWSEYQGLVEQLAARERVQELIGSADGPWSGTCEPAEGEWTALTFLARAAPYAKHRSQFSALFDYRSMEPLIAGPPFERALTELRAVAASTADAQPLSAEETVVRVLRGQSAMAIGTLAGLRADGLPDELPEIGIAPLPGGRDVYNFRSSSWEQRSADESWRAPLLGFEGKLGSLTKESRQPGEAIRLLTFLSGPEMSVTISLAGNEAGPYRESHLTMAEKWLGAGADPALKTQFEETMRTIGNDPNCLTIPRIPGSREYLATLAASIQEALTGDGAKKPAVDVLTAVAAKWNEITDARGRDQQQQAYRQSLGLSAD